MPIKSILMVTHNIEEAVLMCDRIIILSSNPGRIASEMTVNLQHPRNRLDPQFRQFVDTIYARMTKRPDPKPQQEGNFPGIGMNMALPRVSTNTLSGFLEAVAAAPFNGEADLPHIANKLNMEIDDLFPVAETLQLLRFAMLEEGDIKLSDAGLHFSQLDTDARKKLFGEHLMSYVPLVAHIRNVLVDRSTHRASAVRFREELEDHMSEDYAKTTLRSVTNWGRFGELFAYDETAEIFSLEDPN